VTPQLTRLYEELRAYPCNQPEPKVELPGPDDLAATLRVRHGDRQLAFFSTVATFGAPLDVTVAELAIESFFPADPTQRRCCGSWLRAVQRRQAAESPRPGQRQRDSGSTGVISTRATAGTDRSLRRSQAHRVMRGIHSDPNVAARSAPPRWAPPTSRAAIRVTAPQ
jgi:MmyB-like transcription regulator ligand binding domain